MLRIFLVPDIEAPAHASDFPALATEAPAQASDLPVPATEAHTFDPSVVTTNAPAHASDLQLLLMLLLIHASIIPPAYATDSPDHASDASGLNVPATNDLASDPSAIAPNPASSCFCFSNRPLF